MKIGDVVYSTKVRPGEHATITKTEIDIHWRDTKKKGRKKEIRTKYMAEFNDGTFMKFYGFDIGKTIFRHEECKQITLTDLFELD